MSEMVLPDQFRCSYPFKFCNNQRAVKKNGKPHRLCPEHRDRANKHHAELIARKRQIKDRVQQTSNGSQRLDHQLAFDDIADLLDDDAFLRVTCSEDDLKAVESLISDSEPE